MRKLSITLALAVFALAGSGNMLASTTPSPAGTSAQASDPGITTGGVIGEVTAIDVAAKQMTVKTDAGSVVNVALADNTAYRRIPPGETTLDKATNVTLAEVGVGDRVFARGKVSDDKKTVPARMLVVMSKGDITQKQEAERAEWRKRGVVGEVTALNPQTKEITLKRRGGAPDAPPVVMPAGGNVKFRRYAPDSVKFSDAKPSTFEELKVGDQLRAKGERSEDGARFTPEEVVSGSFRIAMGSVTAVNAEKNEITIKTMQGQPLTIVVSRDSMLRRVPAEMAAMMAGGGGPGAGGPGGPAGGGGAAGGQRVVVRSGEGPAAGGQAAAPPAGGNRPAGAAGGPPQGGPGGPGGGGRPDLQEMLERLPATTVGELKPGSMLAVSSTAGSDPTRVTAIQLVSGIDALMGMMQGRPGGARQQPSLGNLNLGFGIGAP